MQVFKSIHGGLNLFSVPQDVCGSSCIPQCTISEYLKLYLFTKLWSMEDLAKTPPTQQSYGVSLVYSG